MGAPAYNLRTGRARFKGYLEISDLRGLFASIRAELDTNVNTRAGRGRMMSVWVTEGAGFSYTRKTHDR